MTESQDSLVQQAIGNHVYIQNVPRLNANILVSDEHTCITSRSFLSQQTSEGTLIRDIGLIIEGREPTDHILDRISEVANESGKFRGDFTPSDNSGME